MHPDMREAGVLIVVSQSVGNFFPRLPQTRETLRVLANWGATAGQLSGLGQCGIDKQCLKVPAAAMNDTLLASCWASARFCIERKAATFSSDFALALRRAFTGGSYTNEGDIPSEPEWQDTFWGANYPRLLRVKQAVDARGLFVCRHCVGSEGWDDDGNCRIEP